MDDDDTDVYLIYSSAALIVVFSILHSTMAFFRDIDFCYFEHLLGLGSMTFFWYAKPSIL